MYNIPTTSTPNYHAQRIGAVSVCLFNLHKTVKLPPVDKEHIYFRIDDKSAQSTKCVKYRIITKLVYFVISIDTFEKKVS